MANGYVPPVGSTKGSAVDKFLQYRRKFQEAVPYHHNPTSSPDWFKNATSGLYTPGTSNALGTTNK